LRGKIENFVIEKNPLLLNFIQSKITQFNSIKEDFTLKNYLDYDALIHSNNLEMNGGNNNVLLKNETNNFIFYRKVTNTQAYYIEKAINELNDLYKAYSPIKEEKPKEKDLEIITEEEIDKDAWENLLKGYSDILTTKDLADYFKKETRTINEWTKKGYLTPIDRHKHPMSFTKDEVKKYILKKRV
jgi:Fe-S cluster biosynthesis and repair protein YggX